MSRCQTRSGDYQCERAAGHGGDCEAEDKSRPKTPDALEATRVRERRFGEDRAIGLLLQLGHVTAAEALRTRIDAERKS